MTSPSMVSLQHCLRTKWHHNVEDFSSTTNIIKLYYISKEDKSCEDKLNLKFAF